jgi:hypothetical protein
MSRANFSDCSLVRYLGPTPNAALPLVAPASVRVGDLDDPRCDDAGDTDAMLSKIEEFLASTRNTAT